mmetsp:Transcript_10786/g.19502  ORF Transcript_10786/g.19502 Transcript_10786/m.19502 type:complete len:245 (-) Transcript_10786:1273-2007(-)
MRSFLHLRSVLSRNIPSQYCGYSDPLKLIGFRGFDLTRNRYFHPSNVLNASRADHGLVQWHGTTILSVRKGDRVCVVGDGQVSMGSVIVKPSAKKVRRIGPGGDVIAGFAGATSDAMTLLERLEMKIEEHPGQLLRACVSLAKDWRMDKYLRRLEALLVVSNKDISLTLTGNGDVLDSEDGIVGIGSGGNYAIAAARALMPIDGLDADEIAKRSMHIAAGLCCYTNTNFIVESIDTTTGKLEKK